MKCNRILYLVAAVGFGMLLLLSLVLFSADRASALQPAEPSHRVPTALPMIDDFEAGMPSGWYWDADWGNTVMTTTVVTEPHMTVPGQITNSIFSLEFISGGWGGSTGNNLSPTQTWSAYDGVSFWMYGSNSGVSMRFTLTDDGGEGFEAVFTDDVAGWKLVSLPWE